MSTHPQIDRRLGELAVVTEPTEEPLALPEVKRWLRHDGSDDDDTILELIQAAREDIEPLLRRTMVTTTYDQSLDCFPLGREPIVLQRSPAASVSSITYTDEDGDEQTWAASNYTLNSDREPAEITPAYGVFYPATRRVPQAVTIRFVAGYGDPGDVPAKFKRLHNLYVAEAFYGRLPKSISFGTGELRTTFDRLLQRLQVKRFV